MGQRQLRMEHDDRPGVTEVCLPQPAHSQVQGLAMRLPGFPRAAASAENALRPAGRERYMTQHGRAQA
jgi:hypothetical protein